MKFSQCVVCGRGFAQKSNVKKHMVTHKVLPTKPLRQQDTDNVQSTSDTFYQCSICKVSFFLYSVKIDGGDIYLVVGEKINTYKININVFFPTKFIFIPP